MPTCKKCNKDLPSSAFSAKDSGGKYHTHCKKCKCEYSKKWYKDNKERMLVTVRANNAKYKQQTRDLITELKKSGCVVCGEQTQCCLDFHHKDQNTKEFSIASAKGRITVKSMLTETNKCVIVCANCHRKLHAGLIKLPE